MFKHQRQFFYLAKIATIKQYRQTLFRPVYGIFFLWLHFACDSPEAYDSESNNRNLDSAVVLDNFEQFSNTFTQLQFPFSIAQRNKRFETIGLEALPDSLIDQFLTFEPWTQGSGNNSPSIYKVGKLNQSDTSCLLLYYVKDSVGAWFTENVVLSHVHYKGRLIDRFVLGHYATIEAFEEVGTIEILQTGSLINSDSGAITYTKWTNGVAEEIQSYTLRISPNGELISLE